jgi:N-acetylglucosamine-6-phosphate deacetylase
MIVLAGADLVLPDRVVQGGALVVDGERIVAIEPVAVDPAGAEVRSLTGHVVVPGFLDVHVHGVAGADVLDGP